MTPNFRPSRFQQGDSFLPQEGSMDRQHRPRSTLCRRGRRCRSRVWTHRRIRRRWYVLPSPCLFPRSLTFLSPLSVWNVQPSPKDHCWRTMKGPNGNGNGMVAHYSGTTLDAQARYATGTLEILENWDTNKPQTPANIIVENGDYATKVRSLFLLSSLVGFVGGS